MKTRHYIKLFILALIVVPLSASVPIIAFPIINLFGFVLIYFITRSWYRSIKYTVFPDEPDESGKHHFPNAAKVFTPIVAAYVYYMLVWMITFGITGYLIDDNVPGFFSVLTFPYFTIRATLAAFHYLDVFPIFVTLITAIIIAAVLIAKIRSKSHFVWDKKNTDSIYSGCWHL
jgi:hypothetical protein